MRMFLLFSFLFDRKCTWAEKLTMSKALLRKQKPWEEENVLAFPNMDEVLKVKNEVNIIAFGLQKIVRSISPSILHHEINPVSDRDELMSVRETARMLGVSERTVGHYREKGLIACLQYNERKIMYRKADIISFQNRSYKRPRDYCE